MLDGFIESLLPRPAHELLRISLPFVLVLGVPTVFLICGIAIAAKRHLGKPLSRSKRFLVLTPALLLLLTNLLGVLSWRLPGTTGSGFLWIRYSANHTFDTDWLFAIAIVCILILPFALADFKSRGAKLIPVSWGGHLLWSIPFSLLLHLSGAQF